MSRTDHTCQAGVKHRTGTAAFRKTLLARIKAQPGQTIPELAEFMGSGQNHLYRVLPAMQKDQLVEKRGRGWWVAGDNRVSTSARPGAILSEGVHTCDAGCPCHDGRAPLPDFVEARACEECDGTGGVEDYREREAFDRSGGNPEYAPAGDECPACAGSGWVEPTGALKPNRGAA